MVRERIKGDVVLFVFYNRCKFLAAKNVMEYLGKNVSGMSLIFSWLSNLSITPEESSKGLILIRIYSLMEQFLP
jgi:hypothetical protein